MNDIIITISIVSASVLCCAGLVYGLREFFTEEKGRAPRVILFFLFLISSIWVGLNPLLGILKDSDGFESLLIILFAAYIDLLIICLLAEFIVTFPSAVESFVGNLPWLLALCFSGLTIILPIWLMDHFQVQEELKIFAGIALLGCFFLVFKLFFSIRRNLMEYSSRKIALIKNRPYFLLLRSFSNSFNVDAPEGLSMMMGNGSSEMIQTQGISVIPRLAKALNHFGAVVTLGKFKFQNDQDAISAIQIKTNNNDWWEKFKYLAEHARGIVMIPSDTNGVINEMEALYNDTTLWKKTILFFPQELESEFFMGSTSNENELIKGWYLVEKSLNQKGINIPSYRGEGFLYVPNTDHKISVSETNPFRMSKEYHRALKELIPSLDSDFVGFKTVSKELG